ncbi:kinase-like domain-containing protein [Cercophora scortea]|uniref:Kinase-like domain-containing protein n=1 Tax=Cercophora scortea TaxID=314031 RepID=A0AAE0MLS6_9PEZI|nr:kinase-like domain-containing protein [Cercophora scortea]
MAPQPEGSHLKRARVSGSPSGPEFESFKKPRRSERLSQRPDSDAPKKTPVSTKPLPSPVTHSTTDGSAELFKEATATPPEGRPSQVSHRNVDDNYSQSHLLSSPPQDTQAFPSQPVDPNAPLSDEVEDEVKEGVWGYLFPLDTKYGGRCLVMRKRACCPLEDAVSDEKSLKRTVRKGRRSLAKDEESFNQAKPGGLPSGGYLIGRHPECDIVVDDPIISNRHCLLFTENKGHDTVAILEDLSSNGTFVNEALVGRNQRRELQEHDEIAVLDKARFIFKYPKSRHTSAFTQQYTTLDKLGKGHFAEVYLCVEKATGQRYAVKIFTKTPGVEERSKNEGLQQEIAVLMGVSHPNVLCLKDTFNEPNAVYLVLELAPEGELFNFIVKKQKLTEAECRKLFTQLFQGVKYLHDRNIVHRDIKPENILLVDKDLHVKLADFGLAKIIGEESFTTTLCGTPSYVAPEILADNRHRKYTKAVDIWSLGVVLYICLCGFPPFSDELTSPDFPYSLSEQIKKGKFDYPSPYWDPVGDPALDLIDSMLIVDPQKRFTIDQCLAHPWMTAHLPNVNDSTNGLVSGVASLEVTRRGVARERTLLSSINTVQVTSRVPMGDNRTDLKVYAKNPGKAAATPKKEARPADQRDPREFLEMGGKGDQVLFGDDEASNYPTADIAQPLAAAAPASGAANGKTKGKGKAKGR